MYNPGSSRGLRLLAHEAAHVVQQAEGQVSGVPYTGDISISEPGDRFEQAAEAKAKQIVANVTLQQMAVQKANALDPDIGQEVYHSRPIGMSQNSTSIHRSISISNKYPIIQRNVGYEFEKRDIKLFEFLSSEGCHLPHPSNSSTVHYSSLTI